MTEQRERFAYTVEQIEGMLLGKVDLLARSLAPQGNRRGHEWVALNPARPDRKVGSFSINLRNGKWADFAEGRAAKTLPCLALISYLATAGDFSKAIAWAKDWLNLTGYRPDPVEAAKISREAETQREVREREDARRDEAKRKAAHGIWLGAPNLDGTDPASRYLRARMIDVLALPDGIPGALRFNARTRYYHQDGSYSEMPAMVAAMHREGAPNGFAAVHKTHIALFGDDWRKAFGKHSKLILGAKSGALIRLTKGASGKPLKDAPEGEWIAISEGIENGLSAAIARPELRIAAAGSLENVGKVVLPPQMGGVFVIADNDPALVPDPKGPPGAMRRGAADEQLETVCNVLVDRGLDVKIIRAPAGFKDFNDALCNKPMETT